MPDDRPGAISESTEGTERTQETTTPAPTLQPTVEPPAKVLKYPRGKIGLYNSRRAFGDNPNIEPQSKHDMDEFMENCSDINAATRSGKGANVEKDIVNDYKGKSEKQTEGDVIIKVGITPGSSRGAAKEFKDGYSYSTGANGSNEEIDELITSGKRSDASKRPTTRPSN